MPTDTPNPNAEAAAVTLNLPDLPVLDPNATPFSRLFEIADIMERDFSKRLAQYVRMTVKHLEQQFGEYEALRQRVAELEETKLVSEEWLRGIGFIDAPSGAVMLNLDDCDHLILHWYGGGLSLGTRDSLPRLPRRQWTRGQVRSLLAALGIEVAK